MFSKRFVYLIITIVLVALFATYYLTQVRQPQASEDTTAFLSQDCLGKPENLVKKIAIDGLTTTLQQPLCAPASQALTAKQSPFGGSVLSFTPSSKDYNAGFYYYHPGLFQYATGNLGPGKLPTGPAVYSYPFATIPHEGTFPSGTLEKSLITYDLRKTPTASTMKQWAETDALYWGYKLDKEATSKYATAWTKDVFVFDVYKPCFSPEPQDKVVQKLRAIYQRADKKTQEQMEKYYGGEDTCLEVFGTIDSPHTYQGKSLRYQATGSRVYMAVKGDTLYAIQLQSPQIVFLSCPNTFRNFDAICEFKLRFFTGPQQIINPNDYFFSTQDIASVRGVEDGLIQNYHRQYSSYEEFYNTNYTHSTQNPITLFTNYKNDSERDNQEFTAWDKRRDELNKDVWNAFITGRIGDSSNSTAKPSPKASASPTPPPPFVFEFITDGDKAEQTAKDIAKQFKTKVAPYNRITNGEILYRIHKMPSDQLNCHAESVVVPLTCNIQAAYTFLTTVKPTYYSRAVVIVTDKAQGGLGQVGGLAIVSALGPNPTEIAKHEIGHVAGLGDLYDFTFPEQQQAFCSLINTRFSNITWIHGTGSSTPSKQTKQYVDSKRPKDPRVYTGDFWDYIPGIWWNTILSSTVVINDGKLGTPGNDANKAGLYLNRSHCPNLPLWMPYPASRPSIMRTLNSPYTPVEESNVVSFMEWKRGAPFTRK